MRPDLVVIYVTGTCGFIKYNASAFKNIVTVGYERDGTQSWAARYSGGQASDNTARALGLDSDGNVYVSGTSLAEDAEYTDIVTLKYDSVPVPVEIISVLEPLTGPTITPGGPLIEITLKNVSGRSITSLDVIMDEGGKHRRWGFQFGVSTSNLFRQGETLKAEQKLIGGSFGGEPPYGNFPYTLEISGTYEDGQAFSFIWTPPDSN